MEPTRALLDRIAGFQGRVALLARDLQTGEGIGISPDERCPTASVIKLPILVHTLMLAAEGLLDLAEPLHLSDADRKGGSGILQHLSHGLTLSIRDACLLMIALSDNTATNLMIDRVDIEPVNQRMARLGCPGTRLFRKILVNDPPRSEDEGRFGVGVTTPRDMVHLLAGIHEGIHGPDVSREARRMLAAQHYLHGMARRLPPGAGFIGKGGATDLVRNDVGIVTVGARAFALAIFCNQMPEPLWTADNPGLLALADLTAELVRALSCASP